MTEDATGTDPGAAEGTGSTPPAADDTERLKRENAQLRQEIREAQASRLGTEHGLTPAQVDHLKEVPRDQQEKVANLFTEGRTAAPSTSPATEPAAPAAETPPE